jgi:hypothetical protein
MTLRAFHLRKWAVYFAILIFWYAITAFTSDEGARAAAIGTLRMIGIALVPLLLAAVFAWATSRSTTYTVTDRRIVLSAGVALPMTINLPFSRIASASLVSWPDGSGSIAFALLPSERLAYLAVWPHARPWRMARPEPMLRCIAEANAVSAILARAMAASAGVPVQARATARPTCETPVPISALA